ncbi:MAG: type 1 glutamine amidotransferase [Bacteroidales bacterium]|nr:type 1 glutamine amidotransferase [Bacteroidales bacterium]
MKSIKINYLQNAPFEGLGYIETWAEKNHCQLTATKLFENTLLPDIHDFDWLIIMGGPMSVHDEAIYPWLIKEKQFIKSALDAKKSIIGICLGSQLIAEVSGSKVYPNIKKEIGWFPVTVTKNAKEYSLFNTIPESFLAMHWHGDTFDLPEGAIHLMQSEICTNQAFIYKERVLGLQFHLEFTPESLKDIINHCRHELIQDETVQSEEEILKNASLCNMANKYLADILDGFFKKNELTNLHNL